MSEPTKEPTTAPTTSASKMLSVREWAALYGVPVVTARYWARVGRLAGALKVGSYRVIPSDTPPPRVLRGNPIWRARGEERERLRREALKRELDRLTRSGRAKK